MADAGLVGGVGAFGGAGLCEPVKHMQGRGTRDHVDRPPFNVSHRGVAQRTGRALLVLKFMLVMGIGLGACGGGASTTSGARADGSRKPAHSGTRPGSTPGSTTTSAGPASTATSTPPLDCGAVTRGGGVPPWVTNDLAVPGGTFLVTERDDGAGGHVANLVAPGTTPVAYYQAATTQLLAAGWTQSLPPEVDPDPFEREAIYTRGSQTVSIQVNSYNCSGGVQLTVYVSG